MIELNETETSSFIERISLDKTLIREHLKQAGFKGYQIAGVMACIEKRSDPPPYGYHVWRSRRGVGPVAIRRLTELGWVSPERQ